jgi:uncharacterized protein YgiM (DUF1202 family)
LAFVAATILSTSLAHGASVTTASRLNLRSTPSRTNNVLNVMPAGESVEVLPDPSQAGFFKVRRSDHTEGWAHGDFLLLPELPELTPGTADATATAVAHASFPDCGGEHFYRWEQKTTTSGFGATPSSVTVHDVLGWPAPSFHGHTLGSWCIPRTSKEKHVKTVKGWVRRIKAETDGDVHVEITQTKSGATDGCIVVEIPPASISPKFAAARSDLVSLLGIAAVANTDFAGADEKRLRFTGLAFFDGWHLTGPLPTAHGRCNSTVGAAWELHPVFKVESP